MASVKLQQDLREFVELLLSRSVDFVIIGGHAVSTTTTDSGPDGGAVSAVTSNGTPFVFSVPESETEPTTPRAHAR